MFLVLRETSDATQDGRWLEVPDEREVLLNPPVPEGGEAIMTFGETDWYERREDGEMALILVPEDPHAAKQDSLKEAP